MAKLSIKAGATSVSILAYIQDSRTGGPLTGLVFNSAGLTAYYALPLAASVQISLVTLAAITTAYSSGGFKEVDATNMPGWYRLDLPNATIASGRYVGVHLQGAANMAPCPLEIALTGWDNQDAVHGGMSALPNTACTTNASLLTSGTGTDQISANAGKLLLQATQTGVTIPTVTTVTNQLTAAAIATGVWQDATAGDFTVPSSIGKALFISNIVPGAAGGHMISGSNAGTTTFGAMTITGALTVSDGIAVSRSTLNGSAVTATGNGTGSGIVATSGSGATGDGIQATAASTNGNGMKLTHAGSGSDLNATTTPLTLAKTTNITGFNDIAATAVVSSGAITTSGGAVTVGTNNDKTGYGLSAAAVQAIWDALTTALTTVGSIGKLLVTNIDAAISSRSTYAGGDTAGTTTLLSRLTSTRAGNLDNLDATVSSRLASSSYTAPDNADILLIKAKTDNLPASPAATGDAMTLTGAYDFAKGNVAMTESYAASGATMTPMQAFYQINQHLGESSIAGTVKTVKKRNGSTTAKTFTLNDASVPTSITETT